MEFDEVPESLEAQEDVDFEIDIDGNDDEFFTYNDDSSKSELTEKICDILDIANQIAEKLKMKEQVTQELWKSLKQILEKENRKSENFILVRSKLIETGLIHMMFDYLNKQSGTFVSPEIVEMLEVALPSTSNGRVPRRSENNGVGYGFGSTASAWKPEEVLNTQTSTDNYVSELLQILISYIDPRDDVDCVDQPLPLIFGDILEKSNLMPIIRNYLENDSVLDISKHITLYRSIFQLIRAISTYGQLVHLLMSKQNETNKPIVKLLSNIQESVKTYCNRIR
jgi:hypothetical protein